MLILGTKRGCSQNKWSLPPDCGIISWKSGPPIRKFCILSLEFWRITEGKNMKNLYGTFLHFRRFTPIIISSRSRNPKRSSGKPWWSSSRAWANRLWLKIRRWIGSNSSSSTLRASCRSSSAAQWRAEWPKRGKIRSSIDWVPKNFSKICEKRKNGEKMWILWLLSIIYYFLIFP